MTITLKNKNNVDVVYAKIGVVNNVHTFVSQGTSLLDQRVLTLSVRKSGKTNRVVGKLSIPSVVTPASTGVPEVAYTEVGSFDLTAFKAASPAAAEEFLAQFVSLAANIAISDAYLFEKIVG